MKYLLYCILRDSDQLSEKPIGVDGHPVFFLGDGLMAAVSRVDWNYPFIDMEKAMAYSEVIEALGQMQAVIPMRYGCLFDKEVQVQELLTARRSEFIELLNHVDGSVEMGIRVLSDQKLSGQESGVGLDKPTKEQPICTGEAYLADRRRHWLNREFSSMVQAGIREKICRALSGLYKCQKDDRSMSVLGNHPMLSLHFLVPKENVERFREAFRNACAANKDISNKLLLSGPWPPYNFVSPLGPDADNSAHWQPQPD